MTDIQTTQSPQRYEVHCKQCSHKNTITFGYSSAGWVCTKCGNYHVNHNGLGWVSKHTFSNKPMPDILINQTAKLFDTTYTVVGFAKHKQIGKVYTWNEYILFNPEVGLRSLVESDGHWMLIEPISRENNIEYKQINRVAILDGITFQMYNSYRSTVVEAAGEFAADILDDKEYKCTEWIAPPLMLIKEEFKDEEELWYMAREIKSSVIKKAFDIPVMPAKIDIGAIQTMSFYQKASHLLYMLVAYVVLISFLFAFLNQNNIERKVFGQTFTKSATDTASVLVTPPFQVTGDPTSLQVDVYADVTNNWFDLDFELVNDVTFQRYEGAKSIEFYQGYDSEGYWSEGNKSDYIIISQVPAGTYHLNLYPLTNPSLNQVTYTIKVFEGVSITSNFVWLLFIGLLLPAIQLLRLYLFENKRWEATNFSRQISFYHT